MSKITSMILAPLATAVLCAPVVAEASSREPIIVESREAMKQFQADTTRDLDRQLRYAGFRAYHSPGDGYVKIRFTLDEKGRPGNFKTVASTSDRAGERLAKSAVSRLRGLELAPVPNARDATFQANIAYAQDEAAKRQIMAEMQRDERQRFARGDRPGNLIVLGS